MPNTRIYNFIYIYNYNKCSLERKKVILSHTLLGLLAGFAYLSFNKLFNLTWYTPCSIQGFSLLILIFFFSFFQYAVPSEMILYNSLFDLFHRFWLKALLDLFYWSTITLCWLVVNHGFQNSKFSFKQKLVPSMSIFQAVFVWFIMFQH